MVLITCEHQRYELEKVIKAGDFRSCIVKDVQLHKQITWSLVINNVPFHRVNYGAGVFAILHNEDVCPNCSGKGVTK